jgi:hypothetical protein
MKKRKNVEVRKGGKDVEEERKETKTAKDRK